MTRIISGAAQGALLRVPPRGTRPTSDRVREAIFSALEARGAIDGADALDLYAGSGALGLEAISRGAASVTLVENNQRAAALIRSNASAVTKAMLGRGAEGLDAPRIRVEALSATRFLEGEAREQVDLVFIDPPYDLRGDELTRVLGLLAPRVKPWATVVLERSSRDPVPQIPAPLVLERTKTYGETAIHTLALDDADEDGR